MRDTFQHGHTTILLYRSPHVVEIQSVRTPHRYRGSGEARAAMTALLAETDVAGLSTELLASPLDARTNTTKLVNFYRSLGFKTTGRTNFVGHPYMRREPSVTEANMHTLAHQNPDHFARKWIRDAADAWGMSPAEVAEQLQAAGSNPDLCDGCDYCFECNLPVSKAMLEAAGVGGVVLDFHNRPCAYCAACWPAIKQAMDDEEAMVAGDGDDFVYANNPAGKLTLRATFGPVEFWHGKDGSLYRCAVKSPHKDDGQPIKVTLECGPRADNHAAILADLARQFGGVPPLRQIANASVAPPQAVPESASVDSPTDAGRRDSSYTTVADLPPSDNYCGVYEFILADDAKRGHNEPRTIGIVSVRDGRAMGCTMHLNGYIEWQMEIPASTYIRHEENCKYEDLLHRVVLHGELRRVGALNQTIHRHEYIADIAAKQAKYPPQGPESAAGPVATATAAFLTSGDPYCGFVAMFRAAGIGASPNQSATTEGGLRGMIDAVEAAAAKLRAKWQAEVAQVVQETPKPPADDGFRISYGGAEIHRGLDTTTQSIAVPGVAVEPEPYQPTSRHGQWVLVDGGLWKLNTPKATLARIWVRGPAKFAPQVGTIGLPDCEHLWQAVEAVDRELADLDLAPSTPPAPVSTAPPSETSSQTASVFCRVPLHGYFTTDKMIPKRDGERSTWTIWEKISPSMAKVFERHDTGRSPVGELARDVSGRKFSAWERVEGRSLADLRQPPERAKRHASQIDPEGALAKRREFLAPKRQHVRDIKKTGTGLSTFNQRHSQVATFAWDGMKPMAIYSDGFKLLYFSLAKEPYADLTGLYSITPDADVIGRLTWLDNPLANQVRQRIEAGSAPIAVGDGDKIRIVENVDLDRVQIFFPVKPDDRLRMALKGEGWNWSPSNGAWQRKLTANAVRSAERVTEGRGAHPSSCRCPACAARIAREMEDFQWR